VVEVHAAAGAWGLRLRLPPSGRSSAGQPSVAVRSGGAVLVLLAILLAGAGAAAAAPAAPVTSPAANAVLARSPSSLTLQASPSVDARAGRVVVYDAEHRQVARGRASRHGGMLVSDVPRLADGIYTAVWRFGHADGARTTRTSHAFAVSAGGGSPALVQQAKPESRLNPAGRVIPRWLAFAAIMTFIGAAALRLFVTAPATARMASEEERTATLAAGDRRLLLLAGAAILVFIPATLGDLVNRATDKDAGLGFWESIRPGAIADYLTGGPEGTMYDVRLLLTALAAVAVVPAAAGALRRGWRHRPQVVRRVLVAGLAFGTLETIVRVIPTEAPKSGVGWPREIFTSVLDWSHMYAAAIWIGGLAGLAMLGASMRAAAVRRGRFWSVALRRFSVIATVCVGAMILSGLWIAWLHVGPPRLLVHTLYGETLLVKLSLVLILLAVAAANQLWLLPRVDAMRAGGGGPRSSIVLRHFRKTVAAEVALGMLILLVVPFLSGSARNQEFQAKAADLTQTRQVGGHAVRLRPSGVQPGMTDYDVWAPGSGDRVTVAFSSRRLGVPETEVVATSLGGDHYRVTGLYTAMEGPWRARVATRSGPPATFDLGVVTTPAEPENAPPAVVTSSTWAWGLGELLAVLLVLGGAGYSSRRLARRRVAGGTLAAAESAP
jgi:putative copper export protein/methionine-rich copper-binding protein CopC